MTADGPGAAETPATLEFAAWVEPHLPAMTRYAARLVPAADADDVVQEALLRAWRRRRTYDPARGRALPWLLAIVADQGRRRRLRWHMHLTPLPEAAADSFDAHGRDLDLERALGRLTRRQRTAVDLYYFVDLDVATVAEVMGCAPGTVKATLYQARTRLRELLGDNDD
jgi:RNA polymerase sigma-70 factor, ECF subfamily